MHTMRTNLTNMALVIDVINRDGRSICSNRGKKREKSSTLVVKLRSNEGFVFIKTFFKRKANAVPDSPGSKWCTKPHISLSLYQSGELQCGGWGRRKITPFNLRCARAFTLDFTVNVNDLIFFSIHLPCMGHEQWTVNTPAHVYRRQHVMAHQRAFIIILLEIHSHRWNNLWCVRCECVLLCCFRVVLRFTDRWF